MTAAPNSIHKVIVVKLCKKLIGAIIPYFQKNSTRREMADTLLADLKTFERELLRCVDVAELELYTAPMWADLRKKEIPWWLINALFDTLSFTEGQRARCPSVQGGVSMPETAPTEAPTEDPAMEYALKPGDWVRLDEILAGASGERYKRGTYHQIKYANGTSVAVVDNPRGGDWFVNEDGYELTKVKVHSGALQHTVKEGRYFEHEGTLFQVRTEQRTFACHGCAFEGQACWDVLPTCDGVIAVQLSPEKDEA